MVGNQAVTQQSTVIHVNSWNMMRRENRNAHTMAHIRLHDITISTCS